MIKSMAKLFTKSVVKTAAVATVSLGVYWFGREVGRYENEKKGQA